MAEAKKRKKFNYYKQEAKKHAKTLGGGSTPALSAKNEHIHVEYIALVEYKQYIIMLVVY